MPGCEVEGTVVRGSVADGARSTLEVVRALDAAGLEPEGLTVREPSLDDVFLSLTGHRATGPAAVERERAS
jgi:ABC-2 type transport system ATP-binding protein